jgi:hypothetical protein
MFIGCGRSYVDYKASAETWSSIISLAHMWQFETMTQVAFKAYDALSDVDPVDKIALYQRYGFPRKNLLSVYVELCIRGTPLSVEEGRKVGVEALAVIAQTREEIIKRGLLSPTYANHVRIIITNNLIDLKPSSYCLR